MDFCGRKIMSASERVFVLTLLVNQDNSCEQDVWRRLLPARLAIGNISRVWRNFWSQLCGWQSPTAVGIEPRREKYKVLKHSRCSLIKNKHFSFSEPFQEIHEQPFQNLTSGENWNHYPIQVVHFLAKNTDLIQNGLMVVLRYLFTRVVDASMTP